MPGISGLQLPDSALPAWTSVHVMIADAPLNKLSMRHVPEKSAAHAALGMSATTATSRARLISYLPVRANASHVADNVGNAAHHTYLLHAYDRRSRAAGYAKKRRCSNRRRRDAGRLGAAGCDTGSKRHAEPGRAPARAAIRSRRHGHSRHGTVGPHSRR